MNKVIDKGFRSCRFVSTIVKHPVLKRIRTGLDSVFTDQDKTRTEEFHSPLVTGGSLAKR